MVSRVLRRSGVAVVEWAEYLRWQPDILYQCGVGVFHEEVDVMREVWPQLRIVGCEANPRICKGLRKGTKPYPGTLHEVALSDRTGTLKLHCRPRHADGSTLCDLGTNVQSYTVPTTTLDELFPTGPDGKHPFLWLDCEGAELMVLRGGPKFLERVDAVNVEMTANPVSVEWPMPEEIHAVLREAGFWHMTIHTHRPTAGQHDDLYVRGNIFDPRYCSVAEERERWKQRWERRKAG